MSGGMYEFVSKEDAKEFLENQLSAFRFECYKQKDPKGCDLLGDHYAQFTDDMATAIKVWKENCDTYSFGRSCAKYGERLLKGQNGLKRDRETALGYLEKACKADDNRGCFYQAAIYQLGTKFRKPDPEKAVSYFEKSCDLGLDGGCYQAHIFHLVGDVIKQDCNKAVKYGSLACDKHMMNACLSVTRMYELGECPTVKIDMKKALEYRQKYDNIVYDINHPGPQLTG